MKIEIRGYKFTMESSEAKDEVKLVSADAMLIAMEIEKLIMAIRGTK